MRALIVSSDRFEDSELSEPLQQLQAKGVEVDIAAPQQGPITGKHGHRVSAGLALSAVHAEDYDLLLLPGGKRRRACGRSLRRRPSPGISFRPTSPWLQFAMGRSS
jgi:putative intracellular protease/amidase